MVRLAVVVCACLLTVWPAEGALQRCNVYCGDDEDDRLGAAVTSAPMRRGKAGAKGEKGEEGRCDTLERFRDEMGHVTSQLAAANSRIEKLQVELNATNVKLKKLEERPENCRRILRDDGRAESGVYDIYRASSLGGFTKTEVYCDMEVDGGGWITFQRRQDGSINFYRGWDDYVEGFGDLNGEFWMGLAALHRLTANGRFELRADLEDWDGNKVYSRYRSFSVGAGPDYVLHAEGYEGTAGDGLKLRHNGMKFTTHDRDQDRDESRNCARSFTGGFWYRNCHHVNLNGVYRNRGESFPIGTAVHWSPFKDYTYSLKATQLKFRPIF